MHLIPKNKNMNTTFLKLIRWKNLFIIILTMIAMRYAVTQALFSNYKLYLAFPRIGFIFLVLGIVFLFIAGNFINDYFDRKTDYINKPLKALLGFKIRRRQMISLNIIFNILGIICGFIAAYFANKLIIGFLFIFIAAVLWTYSAELKRILFIGNFSLALTIALIPLSVAITEYFALEHSILQWEENSIRAIKLSVQLIIGFSIFAFIFTYIRELVKDCIEYSGDKATGIKSFPTVIGKRKTDFIISALSLISITSIILIWEIYLSKLIFFRDYLTAPFYIYAFIVFPAVLLFLIALTWKASKKHKTMLNLINLIIIFGILFSFIFSLAVYGKI